MNYLQRWKKTIDRNPVDRLPRFYLGTSEFTDSLKAHMKMELDDILYNVFDIDYRFQNDGCEGKSWEPVYIGPELKTYEDGTFDNIWGSRQRKQFHQDGKGSYIETIDFALANASTVAEIDNHNWPQADWFDYQSIVEPIKKYPQYPFMVGYLSLGWFSWETRGMAKCMEDLYLDPAIAEAVVNHIADFGFEYYSRILNAVKDDIGKNVVAIHLADDWGTQDGLLMGPDIFDKYFAKHYRRFTDLAHSHGLKVEFHSCGAARQLYGRMADVGVDIMNPVQTSAAGMVPAEIKAEYGNDLAFSGAIDVQQVLPNASPQEVKDEVKSVLDAMGKDGGFFPGPAHNIQLGTPPENVVAMYKAMDEYYGR
jgi:uroporphyrinogen decarboxylase